MKNVIKLVILGSFGLTVFASVESHFQAQESFSVYQSSNELAFDLEERLPLSGDKVMVRAASNEKGQIVVTAPNSFRYKETTRLVVSQKEFAISLNKLLAESGRSRVFSIERASSGDLIITVSKPKVMMAGEMDPLP